ncbi:integrase catalytic domain-containing protein [Trichonephila clavipes]|nr:integrase catalytic domain-containing protein [Trichonephila clavipes]
MRLNENYTFEGAADRCGQDLASFRCVSVYRMSRYGVPNSFRWDRIDMLLGAEIFYELLKPGKFYCDNSHLVLQNTVFGYVVSRSVDHTQVTENRVHCGLIVDDDLNKTLKKFWEIEGVHIDPKVDTEVSLCEDHFVRTHRRNCEGEVKEDVFETISRFRRHKFAFTTDIQKMYRQILINPDQQDLQRIIWKHGLDAEILTYRLKTVTYGLSNAPFLAIRTLQQLAKNEKSRFPLASETLLYDTYMDDINRSPKGFADASEAAYGAVVYLQCFLHNGVAKGSILASKSRVAPIRVISIPRLELCACVSLAQLVKKIHFTLILNISDIVLHTDSTIALAWLNTPANRLKTFVANRVAKVQELTEGFQWNHVPSVLNPADLVSRGLRPCDLPNLRLWWHGPQFLEKDSDGLLRVGGRLSNSDLPYVNKHPAILPGNHNLTVQIIVHFHRKNLHTGASSLLHYVREKFWPLNGRSLCRKVVHECVVYFKSRPLVTSQLMGNLPRDRVVPDYPFNCSAIHIEIVSDLTSDAFIATLKDFFSRRGKCAKLYSDNGKTFVGANKELKRFLKLIEDSDDNLAGFLSAEGIE